MDRRGWVTSLNWRRNSLEYCRLDDEADGTESCTDSEREDADEASTIGVTGALISADTGAGTSNCGAITTSSEITYNFCQHPIKYGEIATFGSL